MRVLVVVALVLLETLCAAHGGAGTGGVRATLTAQSIGEPALMNLFEDVVARGGYGGLQIERTAFIARRDDGSLECRLWPFSNEFHRQTYRGAMPEGTVAIVHTHPNCCRDASPGDRETARKLQLPFFILTSQSIVVLNPDGGGETKFPKRWNGAAPQICSSAGR